MAAIQLLALLAVAGGAEEVHGQSSKRVQGGQVNIGVVKGQLRLDMVGERRGNSSSELIGRQGRASRGRPSRQSCTAKTGMSFTRYILCYIWQRERALVFVFVRLFMFLIIGFVPLPYNSHRSLHIGTLFVQLSIDSK